LFSLPATHPEVELGKIFITTIPTTGAELERARTKKSESHKEPA
jgi:hypothetical protein